jgi:transcriptional regulator with PAS, ATPase and Fis domain
VSCRQKSPRAGRARAADTLDLKEHEQRLIRAGLERFKGNRRRAAEALNISPVTLWRKMKEYGLLVS